MMEGLTIRSSRLIDLGLLRLRLSTNLESFPAYSYFSSFCEDQEEEADYEVVCIDLDRDHVDEARYADKVDKTFRGKRFAYGYYLVHYFGEPAHLITVGNVFYVFGRKLEKTVWPYFVKHILTIFSADRGFLHLKAAAFELPGGGATLLIGRNGAGKTVFLTKACLEGARFISNTHTLVRDGVAHGVPSSIRVRRDRCFGEIIDRRGLTPHMESGDYVTDAATLFDGPQAGSARVRNIVVADYDPASAQGLFPVTAPAAESFMEQFSFAVTTYGLKDDLLAHHGNDFDAYVASLSSMRRELAGLVRGARCYRANVDMLDRDARNEALRQLVE
ncbi:FomB family phosphonate monophosphate kinase [Nocardiopsis sp. NPDC101807]|uniref:FomB family phosphonate monophosphate kinase n=1 Tax=Nocardiopsis sp. NPDC101807 TaxID=3364339 RepID=UPI00381AE45B